MIGKKSVKMQLTNNNLDEFRPIAISTTAGRYASIEKGARIVIHAIVIIKYTEILNPWL